MPRFIQSTMPCRRDWIRQRILLPAFFVILLFDCLACAAFADPVVLFQSLPGGFFGGSKTVSICSSCNGDYRVFDTFTLNAEASVTSAMFFVESDLQATGFPFPTDITVSIHQVVGGLPGSQIFSQTFSPADYQFNAFSFGSAAVLVHPDGLTLGPGSYDISFFNPQNLAIPGFAGGSNLMYVSGAAQSGFVHDLASVSSASINFALYSGDLVAAPVPGPIIGAGLPGLVMAIAGIIRWRRSRRAALYARTFGDG